ncbi:helix-turn-helix transcriptional regulator [Microbacterium sp. G2-8]|uniref:helix-turn-helix transcriptional regulator n=1 Tax=Microbacterium sp. G2-8 TaxID=2842454 RepID=UPI001C893395|nr:helix-turn-helix transcriptional regulator [Microbacterium sp. G2-8]
MLDDKQIGQNLARMRGEMSQKDLADAMREIGFKWSQATVWSVEKGERPLRLTEAEAIARALGTGTWKLTAVEPESVAMLWGHQARLASDALKEAIRVYDDVRLQLALALDAVPPTDQTNRTAGLGESWIEPGAKDVVDEVHQEEPEAASAGADDTPSQRLSGPWLERWSANSTWHEVTGNGEHPAAP